MSTRGSFVLRLIGAVLLVGLVAAGGVLLYQAGVAQGVARAPEMAQAFSGTLERGEALPGSAYGLGYPHLFYRMHPHAGFFPFGGLLGFLLFAFLFFGLLRLVFFRPWAWHCGPMGGYWRGPAGGWEARPWGGEGKDNSPETGNASEGK